MSDLSDFKRIGYEPLRAELAEVREDADGWEDAYHRENFRAQKAEAENTRLREALEHIASPNRSARATAQDALDMAAFARAALRSALTDA